MQTTTVFSRKGGVGKTSIVILIASYLAASGRRVLLLDLDPQSSLTAFYARAAGINPEGASASEILKPFFFDRSAMRAIHPHLSLIPARSDLREEDALAHPERPGLYLEQFAKEFDHCIIDTSGNWTALSRSAILAAELTLVPGLVTVDDLENALWTCTVTEKMDRRAKIILNQFSDLKHEREVLLAFQEDLHSRLLSSTLPHSGLVRRFTDHGESLGESLEKKDFLNNLGNLVREALEETAHTTKVGPL